MPLEGTVSKLEDLNALWPLMTDSIQLGASHIRKIKTAVQSLLDGTNGVRQLGFDTIEQTLTAASTQITFTGLIQRGCRVTVILLQDAMGGRQITWDPAVFKKATVDIGLAPNTYSIYDFVGHSDGYLWMVGTPRLGVS